MVGREWRIVRSLGNRRPSRPEGAGPAQLAGLSAPVLIRRYPLAAKVVSSQHPAVDVPAGWTPDPTLPLEQALPFPWEEAYATRQPFQPVRLWRNAIALRRVSEARADLARQDGIERIARQLAGRMRDFTVHDGDAAFIENRFDDPVDPVIPPAPWVSAIANAFAILACGQLAPLAGTAGDRAAYGRAFRRIHAAGTVPPDRWITLRDRHGYLWFDEYPRPAGGSTRVKNGHVFAVLALHELGLEDPAFLPLVQAGATTMEAYAACFRRPGLRSLYALDLWRKGDYLPNRAMRQLYQLHELTAAPAFLQQGDLFAEDFAHRLADSARQGVQAARSAAVSAVAARGGG
ncbi:hypothetical protein [Marinovum sp.]|uniref:hypothetical protein n=1 Tax=Marinovum sp. TaxID=2024839 RepID=UPI003A9323C0